MEVYGTAFIETARDLIAARLNALAVTLIGYEPSITSILEGHGHADMAPFDVTVALESATANDGEFEKYSGTGLGIEYMLLFSIRVHACYGDEFIDHVAVERLLNSIVSKLAEKVNLHTTGTTPDYRIRGISDIETNMTFDESDTRGGQVKVLIWTAVEHTQE